MSSSYYGLANWGKKRPLEEEGLPAQSPINTGIPLAPMSLPQVPPAPVVPQPEPPGSRYLDDFLPEGGSEDLPPPPAPNPIAVAKRGRDLAANVFNAMASSSIPTDVPIQARPKPVPAPAPAPPPVEVAPPAAPTPMPQPAPQNVMTPPPNPANPLVGSDLQGMFSAPQNQFLQNPPLAPPVLPNIMPGQDPANLLGGDTSSAAFGNIPLTPSLVPWGPVGDGRALTQAKEDQRRQNYYDFDIPDEIAADPEAVRRYIISEIGLKGFGGAPIYNPALEDPMERAALDNERYKVKSGNANLFTVFKGGQSLAPEEYPATLNKLRDESGRIRLPVRKSEVERIYSELANARAEELASDPNAMEKDALGREQLSKLSPNIIESTGIPLADKGLELASGLTAKGAGFYQGFKDELLPLADLAYTAGRLGGGGLNIGDPEVAANLVQDIVDPLSERVGRAMQNENARFFNLPREGAEVFRVEGSDPQPLEQDFNAYKDTGRTFGSIAGYGAMGSLGPAAPLVAGASGAYRRIQEQLKNADLIGAYSRYLKSGEPLSSEQIARLENDPIARDVVDTYTAYRGAGDALGLSPEIGDTLGYLFSPLGRGIKEGAVFAAQIPIERALLNLAAPIAEAGASSTLLAPGRFLTKESAAAVKAGNPMASLNKYIRAVQDFDVNPTAALTDNLSELATGWKAVRDLNPVVAAAIEGSTNQLAKIASFPLSNMAIAVATGDPYDLNQFKHDFGVGVVLNLTGLLKMTGKRRLGGESFKDIGKSFFKPSEMARESGVLTTPDGTNISQVFTDVPVRENVGVPTLPNQPVDSRAEIDAAIQILGSEPAVLQDWMNDVMGQPLEGLTGEDLALRNYFLTKANEFLESGQPPKFPDEAINAVLEPVIAEIAPDLLTDQDRQEVDNFISTANPEQLQERRKVANQTIRKSPPANASPEEAAFFAENYGNKSSATPETIAAYQYFLKRLNETSPERIRGRLVGDTFSKDIAAPPENIKRLPNYQELLPVKSVMPAPEKKPAAPVPDEIKVEDTDSVQVTPDSVKMNTEIEPLAPLVPAKAVEPTKAPVLRVPSEVAPEVAASIIKGVQESKDPDAIADELGLSPETVDKVLEANGVPLDSVENYQKWIDNNQTPFDAPTETKAPAPAPTPKIPKPAKVKVKAERKPRAVLAPKPKKEKPFKPAKAKDIAKPLDPEAEADQILERAVDAVGLAPSAAEKAEVVKSLRAVLDARNPVEAITDGDYDDVLAAIAPSDFRKLIGVVNKVKPQDLVKLKTDYTVDPEKGLLPPGKGRRVVGTEQVAYQREVFIDDAALSIVEGQEPLNAKGLDESLDVPYVEVERDAKGKPTGEYGQYYTLRQVAERRAFQMRREAATPEQLAKISTDVERRLAELKKNNPHLTPANLERTRQEWTDDAIAAIDKEKSEAQKSGLKAAAAINERPSEEGDYITISEVKDAKGKLVQKDARIKLVDGTTVEVKGLPANVSDRTARDLAMVKYSRDRHAKYEKEYAALLRTVKAASQQASADYERIAADLRDYQAWAKDGTATPEEARLIPELRKEAARLRAEYVQNEAREAELSRRQLEEYRKTQNDIADIVTKTIRGDSPEVIAKLTAPVDSTTGKQYKEGTEFRVRAIPAVRATAKGVSPRLVFRAEMKTADGGWEQFGAKRDSYDEAMGNLAELVSSADLGDVFEVTSPELKKAIEAAGEQAAKREAEFEAKAAALNKTQEEVATTELTSETEDAEAARLADIAAKMQAKAAATDEKVRKENEKIKREQERREKAVEQDKRYNLLRRVGENRRDLVKGERTSFTAVLNGKEVKGYMYTDPVRGTTGYQVDFPAGAKLYDKPPPFLKTAKYEKGEPFDLPAVRDSEMKGEYLPYTELMKQIEGVKAKAPSLMSDIGKLKEKARAEKEKSDPDALKNLGMLNLGQVLFGRTGQGQRTPSNDPVVKAARQLFEATQNKLTNTVKGLGAIIREAGGGAADLATQFTAMKGPVMNRFLKKMGFTGGVGTKIMGYLAERNTSMVEGQRENLAVIKAIDDKLLNARRKDGSAFYVERGRNFMGQSSKPDLAPIKKAIWMALHAIKQFTPNGDIIWNEKGMVWDSVKPKRGQTPEEALIDRFPEYIENWKTRNPDWETEGLTPPTLDSTQFEISPMDFDGEHRIFLKFQKDDVAGTDEALDSYAQAVTGDPDAKWTDLERNGGKLEENQDIKNILMEMDHIRHELAREEGIDEIDGYVHHFSTDFDKERKKRAESKLKYITATSRLHRSGKLLREGKVEQDGVAAYHRMLDGHTRAKAQNEFVKKVFNEVMLNFVPEGMDAQGVVDYGKYGNIATDNYKFGQALMRAGSDASKRAFLKRFGFNDTQINNMGSAGYLAQRNGVFVPHVVLDMMRNEFQSPTGGWIDGETRGAKLARQAQAYWHDFTNMSILSMLQLGTSASRDFATSIAMNGIMTAEKSFQNLEAAAHGEQDLINAFKPGVRMVGAYARMVKRAVTTPLAKLGGKELNSTLPKYLREGVFPDTYFEGLGTSETTLGSILTLGGRIAWMKSFADTVGKRVAADTAMQIEADRYVEQLKRQGVTGDALKKARQDFLDNPTKEALAKVRMAINDYQYGSDELNPYMTHIGDKSLFKMFVTPFPRFAMKLGSFLHQRLNPLAARNLAAFKGKTNAEEIAADIRGKLDRKEFVPQIAKAGLDEKGLADKEKAFANKLKASILTELEGDMNLIIDGVRQQLVNEDLRNMASNLEQLIAKDLQKDAAYQIKASTLVKLRDKAALTPAQELALQPLFDKPIFGKENFKNEVMKALGEPKRTPFISRVASAARKTKLTDEGLAARKAKQPGEARRMVRAEVRAKGKLRYRKAKDFATTGQMIPYKRVKKKEREAFKAAAQRYLFTEIRNLTRLRGEVGSQARKKRLDQLATPDDKSLPLNRWIIGDRKKARAIIKANLEQSFDPEKGIYPSQEFADLVQANKDYLLEARDNYIDKLAQEEARFNIQERSAAIARLITGGGLVGLTYAGKAAGVRAINPNPVGDDEDREPFTPAKFNTDSSIPIYKDLYLKFQGLSPIPEAMARVDLAESFGKSALKGIGKNLGIDPGGLLSNIDTKNDVRASQVLGQQLGQGPMADLALELYRDYQRPGAAQLTPGQKGARILERSLPFVPWVKKAREVVDPYARDTKSFGDEMLNLLPTAGGSRSLPEKPDIQTGKTASSTGASELGKISTGYPTADKVLSFLARGFSPLDLVRIDKNEKALYGKPGMKRDSTTPEGLESELVPLGRTMSKEQTKEAAKAMTAAQSRVQQERYQTIRAVLAEEETPPDGNSRNPFDWRFLRTLYKGLSADGKSAMEKELAKDTYYGGASYKRDALNLELSKAGRPKLEALPRVNSEKAAYNLNAKALLIKTMDDMKLDPRFKGLSGDWRQGTGWSDFAYKKVESIMNKLFIPEDVNSPEDTKRAIEEIGKAVQKQVAESGGKPMGDIIKDTILEKVTEAQGEQKSKGVPLEVKKDLKRKAKLEYGNYDE